MQIERQIKKMSREEEERAILCPSILSSNSMVPPGIIPTDL